MRHRHLPKHQHLLGIWLMLSGITLFGGVFLALWLDARLSPSGVTQALLWLACLSTSLVVVCAGLLLSRRLLTPLRHLHVLMARLAANPDARDDYPLEGWLRGLGPDFERLREGWRSDRQRLSSAHTEGARSAARIRRELEAVLQILDVPLLLCDQHQRLILFNHAAETLFSECIGLGLGKRLDNLLTTRSLQDALHALPDDGTPREAFVPYGDRWLHGTLRRIPDSQGETLLTLRDATDAWACDMEYRRQFGELLPDLRRHSASLSSAASVMSYHQNTDALQQRLETVIEEESRSLGKSIEQLGSLLDEMRRRGERLVPVWSNDLFVSLNHRLNGAPLRLVPIGIPAWFRADAPALLILLERLLECLSDHAGQATIDVEVCLGNKRVYLDLIWQGTPVPHQVLATWCGMQLASLPLSPTVGDLLRHHDSDVWSLADEDHQHARLRLPLPAVDKVGAPHTRRPPRPEFHDFGIAELPSPDMAITRRPLRALDIVAFDTETTGLELRRGDSTISLGACRIVNHRLLADDTFDQRIDPGRPIPPDSTAIHGITDTDVAGAPPLSVVLPRFREYIGDAALLAHNAAFDMLAIQPPGNHTDFSMPIIDTLLLSRALDEGLDGHDLDTLAARYDLQVPDGARHTALGDARLTATLWLMLVPRLEARGVATLGDVLTLQAGAFDREDASA
ncbi:3'-5' exonuclease [Aidingimonas lacisalsi]|uniref:3'-5' exonuclease n=1 Tax=Aidingimonas lacisalsi TaxID=2604086 RepID=UPI0011D2057D|nr:exonuclease domain-containing protein [Aidingimonas lacisalsi]